VSVVVVGINHRSAPLRVLEAVAVAEVDLPKALHDLSQRPNLSEVVLVSTCMRTEVYATVNRFHGALGDIRTFLAEWSGLAPETMSDYVYDYYDDAATRHVLRVASGLDSAVLGEGEILRQIRGAWDVARREGTSGSVLGLLGRHALLTGKRVRTETAIARGTTSLSHTALSLAGSVGAPIDAVPPAASACPVFAPSSQDRVPMPPADAPPGAAAGAPPWTGGEASGSPCSWSTLLARRSILVVGAGEMGRAVATLAAGAPDAGPILVANRTAAAAEALAGSLGARAVPWASLPSAMSEVDIVIVSTASKDVIVDADMVTSALASPQSAASAGSPESPAPSASASGALRHGPLVIVDLSMPRNVAPDVASLPGVVLLDVSHLKAHAEAAMEGRRREVPAAEAIITEEVERLTTAVTQRGAAPLIAALQTKGEAIRIAELARVRSRLGALDDRQRGAVEALTRGIVAKLLHEPTVNLKVAVGDGDGDRLATAVEQLFGL
jgi:glutamyl-tRNA reductase